MWPPFSSTLKAVILPSTLTPLHSHLFALKWYEQISSPHFLNCARAFCTNSHYPKSHACLFIYLRFSFSSQSISWSSLKCLSLWNLKSELLTPIHLPCYNQCLYENVFCHLMIIFCVFCLISILCHLKVSVQQFFLYILKNIFSVQFYW